MPLLRSTAETALDVVAESCRETADEYRTAANVTHDAELAQLFGELEEKRRTAADELMREIREMGNLPDVPDADREALDHLSTRVKAALATSEREALLADCRQREEKLAAAIDFALRQKLPATTLERLQQLKLEGEQIRLRLAAAG